MAQAGATGPSGAPGVPGALGAPGVPGAPGTNPAQLIPGQQNLAGAQQPGMPGQVQPIPGVTIPGMPGQIPGQAMPGRIPGQTGFPGQVGAFPGGRGAFPGQQLPGATGTNNGSSSSGGSSFGAVSNSFGGTSTGGGMPALPGQVVNNGQALPGQPGAPVNSQFGASPYATSPGMVGRAPGIPQAGTSATPPTSQAADMINRILTTPRPGGMPQGAQTLGGATLGGGIAGVASNAEGEGVMVYNEHTKYDEWEFVYDPAKQKQIPNPNATGAGGTPAQQMGTTPGANPGAGPSTGFGGNSGSSGGNSFGGGSSFGGGNSFGGSNSFGGGSRTDRWTGRHPAADHPADHPARAGAVSATTIEMPKSAAPGTVTEYLAAIDEPRRSEMTALHRMIARALPSLSPRSSTA